MRRLNLRHGPSTLSLDLPESWHIQTDFSIPGGRRLSAGDIQPHLDAPIGTPPLREMVKPQDKVCIIVQDQTRPGPTQATVDALVNTLLGAGVRSTDIDIVIGCGTHRMATREETERIVGSDVFRTIRCSVHDYHDRDNLVSLGTTPYGTPVVVNRLVAEADFVVGIANIVPHFLAGFSGGAKIILPGVSGLETIAHNHFDVDAISPKPSFGNVTNNIARNDMEAAAALAGLKFLVNFIPDENGLPIHVVAGDMIAAHRAGAELARRAYTLFVDEPADVVITSAAPIDIDLNQSAKARSIGALALKKGGSMLWVAGCEEGVGFHGLMQDCQRPTLLHNETGEEVYFYSKFISRKEVESAYPHGVCFSRSPSDAIETIRRKQGDRARVMVLRAAPLTLIVNRRA